jgi:flagellar hook-associated protein 1 FlgK
MGITTSLNAALSGLRANQAALDLVANNVANADTWGYTRKSVVMAPAVAGNQVTGVYVRGVQRELDLQLQRQLWSETGAARYAQTVAGFSDRLQRLYGTPGGSTALDTVINKLSTTLDALVTSPQSAAAQSDVLCHGVLLAQTLNSLSADVQAAREEADSGLRSAVDEANASLQTIERLSRQIAAGIGTSAGAAALLDERDRAIANLSSLMDIRVVPGDQGHVSIYTTSGAALFDGTASRLSFDGGGVIGPESLYDPDPDERTIGTLKLTSGSGVTFDLLAPGMVRSGAIQALAQMRDETLVSAQAELDQLAAGLARAFGTHKVDGTEVMSGVAFGFDLDLADLAAGNEISLTFTQTPPGIERRMTIVRVDDPSTLPIRGDATADPDDIVIGVDFSGGLAGAAADLQAEFDSRFGAGALSVSASGGGLRILDDGAAGTVDITSLSARVTATALSGEGLALPFFVDAGHMGQPYTGSLDGMPQQRGFAGRIAVNTALLDDPAKLVQYASGVPSGDTARPLFLRDALESTGGMFAYSAGETNAIFSGSIGGFARQIIDARARDAASAANVADGQTMVLTAIEERFAESSGVDVDEEMARLLTLQHAYAANARVVSAVKEMMAALMEM